MNEVQNQTPNTIPSEAPHPSNGNLFWALILIFMGVCLATAMYYIYKRSLPPVSGIRPMMLNSTTTGAPQGVQPQDATTQPVAQDTNKPAAQVTTEVINQIDDLQKTDLTSPMGNGQVTDLTQ